MILYFLIINICYSLFFNSKLKTSVLPYIKHKKKDKYKTKSEFYLKINFKWIKK